MSESAARPAVELTGFQRDCLAQIARLDAPSGLAVKSALEEHYPGEVRHGRLYPNLDALAADGYIRKGQKDRRTNEYHLTDQGHNALTAHAEWITAATEGERR